MTPPNAHLDQPETHAEPSRDVTDEPTPTPALEDDPKLMLQIDPEPAAHDDLMREEHEIRDEPSLDTQDEPQHARSLEPELIPESLEGLDASLELDTEPIEESASELVLHLDPNSTLALQEDSAPEPTPALEIGPALHVGPELHVSPEPLPSAPLEPQHDAPSGETALITAPSTENQPVPYKGPKRLPWYTGMMMLGHLAVSRDMGQHRVWSEKVEGLKMVEALERVDGHKTRALVRKPKVWRMIRRTSSVATGTNLAVSSAWLVWLIPLYAMGHGFGWLAALTFLLPVPIAWKVGRRLYEDAAIESIRDANRKPTALSGVRRVLGNTGRSFTAGFGFGFTLLFLQGLISWFMTPAPTLLMELVLDTYIASMAGVLSGAVSVMVAPLISHTGRAALTAGRADEPRRLEA